MPPAPIREREVLSLGNRFLTVFTASVCGFPTTWGTEDVLQYSHSRKDG